jgi:hypothetical protein
MTSTETKTYYLRALRAIRATRASHFAAGAGMLLLGIEGIGGEHGMIRPILEIVAGGLLLLVVVYESIQDKRGKHHDTPYEIADFFAALVAIVEGVVRVHLDNFWGSRLSFVWWFVATMFIAKAIYGRRLRFLNNISLTESEFVYRRPFRKTTRTAWTQVTGFEIADMMLVLERAGQDAIRIDLNLYEKPEMISEWCKAEIPNYWMKPEVQSR